MHELALSADTLVVFESGDHEDCEVGSYRNRQRMALPVVRAIKDRL